MRPLLSFIALAFLSTAPLLADGPVRLDIRYTSQTKLDIALFAFEEPFVHAFPGVRFTTAGEKPSSVKTVRIELGCLSVKQLVMGTKKYDIYTAKVKGKITILLASGEILWSKDLELVSEPGGTPVSAESAALKLMREKTTALLEREKSDLEAILD